MNNLKYAVVTFWIHSGELFCTTNAAGFSSCIEAETCRSNMLKTWTEKDPQMVQVIQYVETD